MPVEPSDIGWTPWVRQTVQLSAAEIFLAEPPEPRRRRNSRTASRIPPPPPRPPLPRDLVSLLFACPRCLPVIFLPSVSNNGAAGVRPSSKKSVGSGPRGLGPDGSSVVLPQSVYFAQRGGVVRRVVEWSSGGRVGICIDALASRGAAYPLLLSPVSPRHRV